MTTHRKFSLASRLSLVAFLLPLSGAAQQCQRTVIAKVAAIDQVLTFNRLGAMVPEGAIFALARDVVSDSDQGACDKGNCKPGNVHLREDKRPRPLTLRVNVGDCLVVEFTNLLQPAASTNKDGMNTRYAGVHIEGLELRKQINSDASWTGNNPNSLVQPVSPGGTATYEYYAKEEGTFFLYSLDTSGRGPLPASQLQAGLFGSINVEPPGAEYYRSQVTSDDLRLATAQASVLENRSNHFRLERRTTAARSNLGEPVTVTSVEAGTESPRSREANLSSDGRLFTPDGHPIIDYDAVYPSGSKYAGLPILNMLRPTGTPNTFELVYNDLTAIITGPGAGDFTSDSPSFNRNPVYPDRRQPYREFSIIYHNFSSPGQAFPVQLANGPVSNVINAGGDFFAINYGMGGIAPEVVSNRLKQGPSKDCVECKFEEFFLSSWAVGDPAMLVDTPTCSPDGKCGTVPTKAIYADDPSNVYHSYLRDHVKFRIHNASLNSHVHHQHAHQWLHTPNSDNSIYLDSQMIIPGASYTLEIAYGGSGNRNLTAGDSIFHCHFYTHFAEGMWSLWRVHDVFEPGTELDPASGKPKAGSRALPDGEIASGTPIPAIVPLPTLGMAPMPAKVELVDNGRRANVIPDNTPTGPVYRNPGYPFFVPGIAGHRAPHPPMDFAWEESEPGIAKAGDGQPKTYLDGGLPRHLVVDGQVARHFETRWDFTKDFVAYDNGDKTKTRNVVSGWLQAFQLPEKGTKAEIAAMNQHSGPPIQTYQPNGHPGVFLENGLPPVPGGPFANPDVSLQPGTMRDLPPRRYKAAVIQTDAVFNKKGWHFPQQRLITLWGDVQQTLAGKRPPQPFFFRADSGQSIEFWHTNLVPNYYEMDDFQVRTPTDILGQHIHLVKFDVLASDGAANGFNYEDGTLSPDDVRERIDAIMQKGGLYQFDDGTQWMNPQKQIPLKAKAPPADLGNAPIGQNWLGAQTTVQRWSSDPVQNNYDYDRTLRSVFTHDHYGPSTHQQAGLYSALLVEPRCSSWTNPIDGSPLYDPSKRTDGGPTDWQANIAVYQDCAGEKNYGPITNSYREFALEFQDLQLAYAANSPSVPTTQVQAQIPLFPTKSDYSAQLKNGQPVPSGLVAEMAENGISLSPQAIVSSGSSSSAKPRTAQGTSWYLIKDPLPRLNPQQPQAYETYQLSSTTSSCPTTGTTCQNVFTPEIPAGWANPQTAIAPPSQRVTAPPSGYGTRSLPGPTLISEGQNGTYSLNYRNEPLPLRVAPGSSAPPNATDLSYAFASINRADPAMNKQPTGFINGNQGFTFPSNPLTPGMQPQDPYTPLLRAYEGDHVQVRALVGAHLVPHSFEMDGVNWYSEPTDKVSGFRSVQGMGISEHFEFLFQLPKATTGQNKFADYLYAPSTGRTGLTNGLWGILRAYDGTQGLLPDLKPLPTNPKGGTPQPPAVCPGAPTASYTVVAMKSALTYNSRDIGPLKDSSALIFVNQDDLDGNGNLKPGRGTEPLILRAHAGDCLQITLKNAITDPSGASASAGAPFSGSPVPTVPLGASPNVGLHANLLSFDVNGGNGVNVGFNQTNTVAANASKTFLWYAGSREIDASGNLCFTPVEFGSIALTASDPLVQPTRGLVGALVVEPAGSNWKEDAGTHASASVTYPGGSTFREFVSVLQDCVERDNASCFGSNGPGAINFKSEPATSRFKVSSEAQILTAASLAAKKLNMRISSIPSPKLSTPLTGAGAAVEPAELFANSLVGGDPQTPVFHAAAGSPVRLRLVFPGGDTPQVLTVHGHVWQEHPYIQNSTMIGNNATYSEWLGSQQISPNENLDLVLDSAGGKEKIPGDYLFNTMLVAGASGTWGVLRVDQPSGSGPTSLLHIDSIEQHPAGK